MSDPRLCPSCGLRSYPATFNSDEVWCECIESESFPCACGEHGSTFRYFAGNEYGIECMNPKCMVVVSLPDWAGRDAVAKVWDLAQEVMAPVAAVLRAEEEDSQ